MVLRGILKALFKTADDIVPDTFAVFRTGNTFRRFALKKETPGGVGNRFGCFSNSDGVGEEFDSTVFDGFDGLF